MLIVLAILNGLEIHEKNVNTAVFNGELDKKNIHEITWKFIFNGQDKKVCKSVKFLFGLK